MDQNDQNQWSWTTKHGTTKGHHSHRPSFILTFLILCSMTVLAKSEWSTVTSEYCGDVSGREIIGDISDCVTAANDLDHPPPTSTMSASNYPSGCFMLGTRVYFNGKTSTTKCSSLRPCICKGQAACSITDGSGTNTGTCTCGTTVCTVDTGFICNSTLDSGSCRYPRRFLPVPDITTSDSADRNTGLEKVVDNWINPVTRSSVESTYGPIADWDTSRVTSMDGLFYNKFSFNANISAWDVSNVENMDSSTFEFCVS